MNRCALSFLSKKLFASYLLVRRVIVSLFICFENMLCACEKHLYTNLQIKPSGIFSHVRKEKKKGVVGATLAKRKQQKLNTRVLKNPSNRLIEIVYRRLPQRIVSRFVGRISWRFLVVLFIDILILSVATQVMSLVQINKTFTNVGSVKVEGVGVYLDAGFTNKVASINWGAIKPSSSVTTVVYIRNEATSPVTLSMAASNWNPTSASSYLSLNWNYGGQTLNVGASVQVVVTLSISASVNGITSFSFDITITASAST